MLGFRNLLVAVYAVSFFSFGCSKVQQLAENISIEQLNIATSNLSPAVIGKYYSENITASGGSYPYSFALSSGTIPSGLTFTSTGEISGIPTALATSTLIIEVTDNKGNIAQQSLNLTVSDELIIVTSTLNPASVSQAYSVAISATGGEGNTLIRPPVYLRDIP